MASDLDTSNPVWEKPSLSRIEQISLRGSIVKALFDEVEAYKDIQQDMMERLANIHLDLWEHEVFYVDRNADFMDEEMNMSFGAREQREEELDLIWEQYNDICQMFYDVYYLIKMNDLRKLMRKNDMLAFEFDYLLIRFGLFRSKDKLATVFWKLNMEMTSCISQQGFGSPRLQAYFANDYKSHREILAELQKNLTTFLMFENGQIDAEKVRQMWIAHGRSLDEILHPLNIHMRVQDVPPMEVYLDDIPLPQVPLEPLESTIPATSLIQMAEQEPQQFLMVSPRTRMIVRNARAQEHHLNRVHRVLEESEGRKPWQKRRSLSGGKAPRNALQRFDAMRNAFLATQDIAVQTPVAKSRIIAKWEKTPLRSRRIPRPWGSDPVDMDQYQKGVLQKYLSKHKIPDLQPGQWRKPEGAPAARHLNAEERRQAVLRTLMSSKIAAERSKLDTTRKAFSLPKALLDSEQRARVAERNANAIAKIHKAKQDMKTPKKRVVLSHGGEIDAEALARLEERQRKAKEKFVTRQRLDGQPKAELRETLRLPSEVLRRLKEIELQSVAKFLQRMTHDVTEPPEIPMRRAKSLDLATKQRIMEKNLAAIVKHYERMQEEGPIEHPTEPAVRPFKSLDSDQKKRIKDLEQDAIARHLERIKLGPHVSQLFTPKFQPLSQEVQDRLKMLEQGAWERHIERIKNEPKALMSLMRKAKSLDQEQKNRLAEKRLGAFEKHVRRYKQGLKQPEVTMRRVKSLGLEDRMRIKEKQMEFEKKHVERYRPKPEVSVVQDAKTPSKKTAGISETVAKRQQEAEMKHLKALAAAGAKFATATGLKERPQKEEPKKIRVDRGVIDRQAAAHEKHLKRTQAKSREKGVWDSVRKLTPKQVTKEDLQRLLMQAEMDIADIAGKKRGAGLGKGRLAGPFDINRVKMLDWNEFKDAYKNIFFFTLKTLVSGGYSRDEAITLTIRMMIEQFGEGKKASAALKIAKKLAEGLTSPKMQPPPKGPVAPKAPLVVKAPIAGVISPKAPAQGPQQAPIEEVIPPKSISPKAPVAGPPQAPNEGAISPPKGPGVGPQQAAIGGVISPPKTPVQEPQKAGDFLLSKSRARKSRPTGKAIKSSAAALVPLADVEASQDAEIRCREGIRRYGNKIYH